MAKRVRRTEGRVIWVSPKQAIAPEEYVRNVLGARRSVLVVQKLKERCVMARIRFVSHAFIGSALVLLLLGGAVQSAEAQELSPWTTEVFTPDGDIGEFIDFGGDSQEYFVTLESDSEFGKIKAGATLTPGVFVGLDVDPSGGPDAAGPAGFGDRPGANTVVTLIPTGFNAGRMFVSYNPDLDPDGNPANGTGVYFIAMDVSAPWAMDSGVTPGTQPIAFDVDGDGNLGAQTEIRLPWLVNEAPLGAPDQYQFLIDTNPVFGPGEAGYDVTVVLAEKGSLVIDGPPALEAGAIPFGPQRNVPNNPGTADDDAFTQRYLVTSGIGTNTEAELLPFLDWNRNGMIDEGDFGIGDDVEIAVMNVSALIRNTEPACAGFRVTADTFDDVLLGGGAEDLIEMKVRFPAPDIEAKKVIRCLNPVQGWSTLSYARPEEECEFEVTIQNWGNVDLDVSIIEDVLTCVDPAEWELVSGSCSPAGVFCTAFEAALDGTGSFPIDVGTLTADDGCDMNLGDEFVFTFKIWVGPDSAECVADLAAFCDNDIDCINSVSVRGEAEVDPLPEDQEENGNVDDEFVAWA
ncbi:MAG: hypothetical protein KJ749_15355, partial [Planctomycetes bacterium]|nr:hypothetical protein [Planctomycetota bacterium]